jgi:hypothetical protein
MRDCRDDQAVLDLTQELHVGAICVAQDAWDVDYEPAVDGRSRSPDYRVRTPDHGAFYVEATHIRRTVAEATIEEVLTVLYETVTGTATELVVDTDLGDLTASEIAALLTRMPSVSAWLREAIIAANRELVDGEIKTIWDPGGPPRGLNFTLMRSRSRSGGSTGWGVYGFGIPYTDQEWKAFKNKLDEKIGQLVPGYVNIIAITTTSDTHEWNHCAKVCDDLLRRPGGGPLTLSAIVFVRRWLGHDSRNWVWRNTSAQFPASEELLDALSHATDFPGGAVI